MQTENIGQPTNAPASAEPKAAPIVATPLQSQEILQKMLDMLGLHTKVDHFNMDGSTLLHIATAEPGRLIGKHGQTLNQLQFLLNRILVRRFPDTQPVIVDCERYRERQRDDLLRSIAEASDKVRRWGDPVEIGPFSSFERRIIHHHLSVDRDLEAITEGEPDDDRNTRKKMILRIKSANP
jgi:spoIIIJ-associated protein